LAGVGTATVTYTVVDGCTGSTVNLQEDIQVSDGSPELVCQDITVTLDGSGNAVLEWADVVANKIDGGYAYSLIGGNNLENMTGPNIGLGDDAITGAIPLGFDFEFYGNTYSEVYICSNGFISFDSNAGMTAAQSRTPQTVPDPTLPNNLVALFWGDLDPSAGGTIKFQTFGSAPNRKFVVEFLNVRYWNNPTETVSGQVHLYEGSNLVEIHLISVDAGGQNKTMGIENADGTEALTDAVTNNNGWSSANPLIADFTVQPDTFAANCGNPVSLSLSQSTFTCLDIGENTVTVTADDGNGGISSCSTIVTVLADPSQVTTFNGANWNNGVPTSTSVAAIAGNYDTAADGNLEACSCEIQSGSTVNVRAGEYINIQGNITVDGSLIVEHQGSVVQVDDAAVVNKGPGATINVELTTPVLGPGEFMSLGSPMTAETRMGVFGTAYWTLFHEPLNFIPHPDIPGSGYNFQDDNADNWIFITDNSTINPGEGYLVFPQPNYNDPASTYDLTFEQGTLNNGVISQSIVYNGGSNPHGTPNVLANPYASAIDADALINNNPLINELYFWEHNTPPSSSIPGPYSSDYSMDDISMYNTTMAVPAASGGSAPTGVISTGQGFGIKAFGSGTVSFDNSMRLTTGNNTLRNSFDTIETLTLKVSNAEYELNSYMGVGFRESGTQGMDPGMDSERLSTIISLYSHMLDGSQELGIQTREAFDPTMKIPVGFVSYVDDRTEYVISLEDVVGDNLGNTPIYLYDNQLQQVVDLTQEDYVFAEEMGSFDNRFTIRFEYEVLGTAQNSLEAIVLYPNPTNGWLNIISPAAGMEKVRIVDLQGRLVKELPAGMERTLQVDLNELGSSVYFVTVETADGSITRRIIKN